MSVLTKRQEEILDFIAQRIEEEGSPPTLRELARHFSIRSTWAVRRHLTALEKKGYLERLGKTSRGIKLLINPRTLIPILGRIAAGQPIEAIEDREDLDIAGMFRYKDCFCLRVTGDSMMEDHIRDGDYVIVEKRETAENGETVVALLNGGEVTLKKFFKEKRRIRLEAARAGMKPIYTKDVRILGVVIGVLRKY